MQLADLLSITPERWGQVGWMWVAVVGIAQLVTVRLVERRLRSPVTNAVAGATQLALLVGIVAGMVVTDHRQRVFYTGLLLFLPGFPLLWALVRAHAFGVALLTFMLPPAPFLLLLRQLTHT